MRIETKRLHLHPLTPNQLLKYIYNDHSLETNLGVEPCDRVISEDLRAALSETILPNVLDTTKNIYFCTMWTIIHKEKNCLVGDLCFVGEPDYYGRVELGYGTYDQHQGNGYMTEAVGALISWAFLQPDVKSVVASTDKTNVPSFRVLEKNGFQRYEETEELYYWQAMNCKL